MTKRALFWPIFEQRYRHVDDHARFGDRAARDALHFAALFDRFIQNLCRYLGYDVTMNVYTEVSDEKTLKALKRLGRQLGS